MVSKLLYYGEKNSEIMTHLRFLWVCGIIVLWSACSKEKYDIEYQEGYPNLFADNWIAFEFQGGIV